MKKPTAPTDDFEQLIAARRLRLLLAGVAMPERTDIRPLRLSSAPVRTAEQQEEIDALEHGNMGRMYA